MKKQEKKIIRYSNELEDDFASNNIKRKELSEDYKYESHNIFFLMFSFCFRYLFAIPILWFMNVFIFRVRIKNRKVIKQVKKGAYYVYSNHVLPLDPIIPPVMVNPGKKMIITASHDTFSIHPIVTFLVKALGAIPVPKSKKMYENYVNCMSNTIKRNGRVLIYPEAHIWPYYTGIRNFKSSSFRYPVLDNVPIITMTTTFKKSKIFKKPSVVIYLSGPFYPNLDLEYIDAVNDLRDRAYKSMVSVSTSVENYSYIGYIKE